MRLMQAGAPLPEIMDRIFNRRPFALLRAWSRALETMRLEDGIALAFLSRQARQEVGWNDTDMQGLANLLLSAQEAIASAVLVETEEGQVEVGLRSRPPFDVSGVAFTFGGGGHPQAAGCRMDGPLNIAVEKVITALKRQLLDAEYLLHPSDI